MDAHPDYSQCSLHELRDVAARINRDAFPDRYALVSREIERRESAGEAEIRHARESASMPLKFSKPIYVVGGAIVGFFVGILLLSFTSVEMNPDSSAGIVEMMIATFIGAIAGFIWSVRKIHAR